MPPEKLGAYLRELRALFDRYGYECDLYGHFGQGCVHTRIDFDLETAEGIKTFRAFLDEAVELVVRYGGSISGEHGDGVSKAELLSKMYGPELVEAFRQFKEIWDPEGKMNPGKVVDPDPITIAAESFTLTFAPAAAHKGDRPQVILWPDTFNNYYHPDTLAAAAEVFDAAGFFVRMPQRPLCCGRPLYEFGRLGLAKRRLLRILEALRNEIRAGVPVVVLEPACASVFRDELLNLFPANEDAKRLSSQTLLLCEFLAQKAPDFVPPQLPRKALVHGQCHHKSILKMSGEQHLLDKLGLDYEILDSGCCGMAGSFSFEKDKHAISIACAERVLLPAVRQAAEVP